MPHSFKLSVSPNVHYIPIPIPIPTFEPFQRVDQTPPQYTKVIIYTYPNSPSLRVKQYDAIRRFGREPVI